MQTNVKQSNPQPTERGSRNAFISLLLTSYQYSVRSPLLFRKIVEIERFALLVAILDERQIYVGGGGKFGRRRQK